LRDFDRSSSAPSAGWFLREGRQEDLSRLVELARGSFHADRLHVDANLPSDKADERFARWVATGLRDGDIVFCYDDAKGRTIGFYHVRVTMPGTVDLSLAAIDRAYQKLGIGLLMYQAVLVECRNRGFAVAETHVTVHNVDVLNLFATVGVSVPQPDAYLSPVQAMKATVYHGSVHLSDAELIDARDACPICLARGERHVLSWIFRTIPT
jgi:ribosomal protein S18 acetylase RimI-like enzyme